MWFVSGVDKLKTFLVFTFTRVRPQKHLSNDIFALINYHDVLGAFRLFLFVKLTVVGGVARVESGAQPIYCV